MAIALSQAFKIINRDLSHSVVEQRDYLIRTRYSVAFKLSDKVIPLIRPLLDEWSPLNGNTLFKIPDQIFNQAIEEALEEIRNMDGDSIDELIAINDLVTEIILVGGDG